MFTSRRYEAIKQARQASAGNAGSYATIRDFRQAAGQAAMDLEDFEVNQNAVINAVLDPRRNNTRLPNLQSPLLASQITATGVAIVDTAAAVLGDFLFVKRWDSRQGTLGIAVYARPSGTVDFGLLDVVPYNIALDTLASSSTEETGIISLTSASAALGVTDVQGSLIGTTSQVPTVWQTITMEELKTLGTNESSTRVVKVMDGLTALCPPVPESSSVDGTQHDKLGDTVVTRYFINATPAEGSALNADSRPNPVPAVAPGTVIPVGPPTTMLTASSASNFIPPGASGRFTLRTDLTIFGTSAGFGDLIEVEVDTLASAPGPLTVTATTLTFQIQRTIVLADGVLVGNSTAKYTGDISFDTGLAMISEIRWNIPLIAGGPAWAGSFGFAGGQPGGEFTNEQSSVELFSWDGNPHVTTTAFGLFSASPGLALNVEATSNFTAVLPPDLVAIAGPPKPPAPAMDIVEVLAYVLTKGGLNLVFGAQEYGEFVKAVRQGEYTPEVLYEMALRDGHAGLGWAIKKLWDVTKKPLARAGGQALHWLGDRATEYGNSGLASDFNRQVQLAKQKGVLKAKPGHAGLKPKPKSVDSWDEIDAEIDDRLRVGQAVAGGGSLPICRIEVDTQSIPRGSVDEPVIVDEIPHCVAQYKKQRQEANKGIVKLIQINAQRSQKQHHRASGVPVPATDLRGALLTYITRMTPEQVESLVQPNGAVIIRLPPRRVRSATANENAGYAGLGSVFGWALGDNADAGRRAEHRSLSPVRQPPPPPPTDLSRTTSCATAGEEGQAALRRPQMTGLEAGGELLVEEEEDDDPDDPSGIGRALEVLAERAGVEEVRIEGEKSINDAVARGCYTQTQRGARGALATKTMSPAQTAAAYGNSAHWGIARFPVAREKDESFLAGLMVTDKPVRTDVSPAGILEADLTGKPAKLGIRERTYYEFNFAGRALMIDEILKLPSSAEFTEQVGEIIMAFRPYGQVYVSVCYVDRESMPTINGMSWTAAFFVASSGLPWVDLAVSGGRDANLGDPSYVGTKFATAMMHDYTLAVVSRDSHRRVMGEILERYPSKYAANAWALSSDAFSDQVKWGDNLIGVFAYDLSGIAIALRASCAYEIGRMATQTARVRPPRPPLEEVKTRNEDNWASASAAFSRSGEGDLVTFIDPSEFGEPAVLTSAGKALMDDYIARMGEKGQEEAAEGARKRLQRLLTRESGGTLDPNYDAAQSMIRHAINFITANPGGGQGKKRKGKKTGPRAGDKELLAQLAAAVGK